MTKRLDNQTTKVDLPKEFVGNWEEIKDRLL